MAKQKEWYKRWWAITLFVIVGLIIFSSLLPDSDNNSQTNANQQNSNTKSSSLERILPASEMQSYLITDGLEEGLTIDNIYAIKSNDYSNVYFVGGLVNGAGINNQIMIWATGGYEEISGTFSAEAVAAEFSDWPLGRNTQIGVDANRDEGASILKEYLNSKK